MLDFPVHDNNRSTAPVARLLVTHHSLMRIPPNIHRRSLLLPVGTLAVGELGSKKRSLKRFLFEGGRGGASKAGCRESRSQGAGA
jgi:hypothetical protein